MASWNKLIVILIDGKPNRHYGGSGAIKTYSTFKNAEREARKIMRPGIRIEVGMFNAIDLVEITKEEMK